MLKSVFIIAGVILIAAVPILAQQAGWFGITIEDQKDGSPIVRSVQPNSPALRAGLKEGDVILEYNRESVIGVQQLSRLIRETPVGRQADLKIRRENREQTIQITAEASRLPDALADIELNVRPNVHMLLDQAMRNIPRVEVNTSFVQVGIRVDQLTGQLREFFGVFSNNGVLVSSVEAGSAAEKAGVKAGDVITEVNGKTIRTPGDFSREMRMAGGKETLKVMREKQERTINVE